MLIRQLKKRRVRNAIGSLGASIGAVGSVLLFFAALLSAAAMVSPIGWAFGAVAAAIALGIGAYKLISAIAKRAANVQGKFREHHAQNIYEYLTNGSPEEKQEAERFVKALGLSLEEARNGDQGRAMIATKLKSF